MSVIDEGMAVVRHATLILVHAIVPSYTKKTYHECIVLIVLKIMYFGKHSLLSWDCSAWGVKAYCMLERKFCEWRQMNVNVFTVKYRNIQKEWHRATKPLYVLCKALGMLRPWKWFDSTCFWGKAFTVLSSFRANIYKYATSDFPAEKAQITPCFRTKKGQTMDTVHFLKWCPPFSSTF